jgi:probable F420-dependent oxidoreductase
MALKDRIPFGMSLPHRSLEPIPVPLIVEVAQRAEVLGFRELWVTENTIDPASCFDALTLLSYTAAVTSTIGLGVAVVVLPVHSPLEMAHRVATLDYLSGGRAILGAGIGPAPRFTNFQVPLEHRVTRFRESIELMKALWTEERVTYNGRVYSIENAMMGPKPVHKPHPPVWLGGDHPDNLKRTASIADGWIAGGGSTNAKFAQSVVTLRAELEAVGRDPSTFPISKRVFLFVDDDIERARGEVDRWFDLVYHDPSFTTSAGVWGTPSQVVEQLEELIARGANHLLLSPVSHYREQLEKLATLVGLSSGG